MRTKQAIKNTVFSILLQIVAAISGILVPRLFTALYGSAVNGLVSSIGQFITYMGLVEAGIGASSTVALYRPLADRDNDEISSVVSAAKKFYNRSGLIFAGLVGCLVVLYPLVVRNEIADVSFIRMMIVVLSVSGLVDYFFLGKYRVLLTADQRGYVISIAQIVGTIIMTVFSILLMNMNTSAIMVKAVTAIVYVLRSVAIAIYVKRNYPDIQFNANPKMEALSQRWDALLHQIVGMISCNTDMVLLTLLLTHNALSEVSVYSVYNLVAYAIFGMMNAVCTALSSGFGQVISKNEKEVLRSSYSSYEFIFFMFIFIAYTCMAVLLYSFIGLYSRDFADASIYVRWSLVVLFTLSGFLQSIRLPSLTLVHAAGHYSQTKSRAILEAIINLGVSLTLIRSMGINGVLLGTCAAFLYRSTDCIIYADKYFLPGSLKVTVKRLLINLIMMIGLVSLGFRFLPRVVNGWGIWFVIAFITFGIVSLCYLGLNAFFDKTAFGVLKERFVPMLKKRK